MISSYPIISVSADSDAAPHNRPETRQQGRASRPPHNLRDQERSDRPGEQTLIRMPRVAELRLRDQPAPKIVKLSNHPSPLIKTPHRDVASPAPMPVMMVSLLSRTGG